MARIPTMLPALHRLTLPILGRYGGSRFWLRAKELRKCAAQPYEARRKEQLAHLNDLLRHAVETVPFHRNRLGPAPPKLNSLDELSSLPLTTKADLTSGFPDRVTDQGADRSCWQIVASSGTVSRVVTVKNFDRRDLERAALLHVFTQGCGYRPGLPVIQIPPNICNLVCGEGATSEDESFRRELARFVAAAVKGRRPSLADLRGAYERRLLYRTRILDPLAPSGTSVPEERLESYWKRIHAARPYLLHALPEYLLLLADWARSRGLGPLGVPCILPMGGSSCRAMRERITEGLGGRFFDVYGTAELGPIAFESQPGEGLRVICEHFLVEVVRDNRPAAAGEPGRLVLTDLRNRAMPFLRYEVGDIALWKPAPEGAADSSPRLFVLCRQDEVLEGREGDLVTGDLVKDLLFGPGDLAAFSLRERAGGRLALDYVPRTEPGAEPDRLIGLLRSLLAENYRIKARRVGSIPSESSGKFRFVRSEATRHAYAGGDAAPARAPAG